jgi:hypothetical protein
LIADCIPEATLLPLQKYAPLEIEPEQPPGVVVAVPVVLIVVELAMVG